jgi:hypothetical protein
METMKQKNKLLLSDKLRMSIDSAKENGWWLGFKS